MAARLPKPCAAMTTAGPLEGWATGLATTTAGQRLYSSWRNGLVVSQFRQRALTVVLPHAPLMASVTALVAAHPQALDRFATASQPLDIAHRASKSATHHTVQTLAARRHFVHHQNVLVSAVSSSEPVDLPHLAQYCTWVTPSWPGSVCASRISAKRR